LGPRFGGWPAWTAVRRFRSWHLPLNGSRPNLQRPPGFCMIDGLLARASGALLVCPEDLQLPTAPTCNCLQLRLAAACTYLLGPSPYPTRCSYHLHRACVLLLRAAKLRTPRPFHGCLALPTGASRSMLCSHISQPDYLIASLRVTVALVSGVDVRAFRNLHLGSPRGRLLRIFGPPFLPTHANLIPPESGDGHLPPRRLGAWSM